MVHISPSKSANELIGRKNCGLFMIQGNDHMYLIFKSLFHLLLQLWKMST